MKKDIAGIILLLIAVLAMVIIINKETSDGSEPLFFDKEYSANETNPEEGSSGETSNDEEGDKIEKNDSLYSENKSEVPEDINETECGYYYEEYNVCGGICPEGECVSKGRSCYCQKD